MSDSILVVYATRYGSTQEVADTVAATLREGGLKVDVQPVKQVRTLDGYRAVVVGAPLYMFDWLKEARDFVSRHRAALEKMPPEFVYSFLNSLSASVTAEQLRME